MTLWPAALLLLAAAPAAGEGGVERVELAQVTVRQQIIVRVPVPRRAPAMPARRIEWKESKGPKCVPFRAVAGAALLGRDSVDLILRDSSRVRAELENSCPALDYYQGFYINPNSDGMICADRDVIRSRIGGQCEIERFRALRPKARD